MVEQSWTWGQEWQEERLENSATQVLLPGTVQQSSPSFPPVLNGYCGQQDLLTEGAGYETNTQEAAYPHCITAQAEKSG